MPEGTELEENVELEDVYPPEGDKAAPKDKAPEPPKPKEKKQEDMPADKPMKVPAAKLETVILIPKGYQGQYPVAQAANEQMLSQQEEISKLKEQVQALSKAVEEKDNKISELSKNISERETADRTEVASEVVELKLSSGIMALDENEEKAKTQKDAAVKELSKLPIEQLKTLRTEVKTLSKKPEGSSASSAEVFTPGIAQHKDLSNSEVRKAELRKKMFGHSKPLGEEE